MSLLRGAMGGSAVCDCGISRLYYNISHFDGFLMVCVQNVCRKAAFTTLYSKLFDILMVFLKELFKKVDFEKKNSRRQKSMKITQNAKSSWMKCNSDHVFS